MSYHHTSRRTCKAENHDRTGCWQRCGKLIPRTMPLGAQNGKTTLEHSWEYFFKKTKNKTKHTFTIWPSKCTHEYVFQINENLCWCKKASQ